ncbi:MAG TPA: DUF1326 domain-containing protein [Gemmatimonadales bacterium]|jgi:hypothetical protein|nr:DUF1326 domain-containing protein [Gemmatimonadales bacterium]
MNGMHLSGNVLIACNCDWGCPCNFNAPPSKGHCEGGWIWAIDSGNVDDVAVDGLAVAVFADWPGAIHEGGGKAAAYIDERANEAQRAALSRVLRGEAGGPWAIFINTYELAGPHLAPFQLEVAGLASQATVGGVAELQMDSIRNPVSGADAHPEMVLPEGIVVKRGSLGASKVFTVTGHLAFDHSGQYAALGPFEYAA